MTDDKRNVAKASDEAISRAKLIDQRGRDGSTNPRYEDRRGPKVGDGFHRSGANVFQEHRVASLGSSLAS